MPALLVPLVAWLGTFFSGFASWIGSFLVMAFASFAASAIVPLAKKLLLGLGFGYVVYKGLDVSFEYAKAQIEGSVNGLPADVLTLFGWLEIDRMITLLFSAYSIRLALTLGANSGLLRKV